MGRNAKEPVFIRLRVESDKRDRFKIACIRLKTNMDTVLNELLDKWLEENDPSPDK
ncbi:MULTISPECIES: plasmid partition protein ParG [unclassified Tolypothrix]|uniref:plasmid partition protein ParG n=1 Tax=unclassified Tolypothrix TaxID=2649714 RepID=UPI0005EAB569|nr:MULTISPECIES: plasmid partition protein ParG [unclassified Tolypothrix]BAY95667.1 plasmid partition protein ParG [Microchaete diplosiphon NIES-3275]EKE96363.1 putative plasmid partition protein [Tolypothrix sp. PCC 7601]MBE9083493.1 plasmid partition protein [Tolypothrix sp. LEGE 11397]UYD30862.1 plasmid partition protein [Tolypothrix sp. PCC 7712]UYD38616.1 plasmid partition protein [Tolypothrix sp. PCC 7601]